MSAHLILLHESSAGTDHGLMLRYWRDVRAPWATRLPSIRGYVQNIVLAQSDGRHNWFGVEECWTEDAPAALELLSSLSHPALNDHPAVEAGCQTRMVPLLTTDHVVVAGAPIGCDEALPKRMTFLRRKPGLSHDEAIHYWRHSHGPLAAKVPGGRRYVQSPVTVAPGAEASTPPIDGVAQIWMDGEAVLQTMVASPLFRERVKPDEANFADTALTFTLSVREHRAQCMPPR